LHFAVPEAFPINPSSIMNATNAHTRHLVVTRDDEIDTQMSQIC
jgi:hypothetical protein